MGAVSASFSNLTGATYAVSSEIRLAKGQTATYTVAGTLETGATIYLESSKTAGCFDGAKIEFSGEVSASGTLAPEVETAYRFRIDVIATKKQDAAVTCTLTEQTDVLGSVNGTDGQPVVKFTEQGMATDVIAEKTAAAGVTVDGLLIKDGGITSTIAAQFPMGSALGRAAAGFGETSTEGMQIAVAEETLSFVGNAALFLPTSLVLPAGSVILSVQANVEAALTGGSTTVKVGLGLNASDPDKYGLSSALTKNAKISTMPAYAVLAGATTIDVCACAANGAAGDTALTVGSVRVRIVYAYLENLANA